MKINAYGCLKKKTYVRAQVIAQPDLRDPAARGPRDPPGGAELSAAWAGAGSRVPEWEAGWGPAPPWKGASS